MPEPRSKQLVNEIKTFPVPTSLVEIKNIISISTNFNAKNWKEKLIHQAIQNHQQGNISDAKKYYENCINKGLEDHRVFCNYGTILKDLGKLKEAELLTRKAIQLKPDFYQAYLNLGTILKELGNLKGSEYSLRKAIDLNADYAEAHFNLGNTLRDSGSLQKAEISYRKAIQLKPDFSEAHSNLGTILKDIGQLKEAESSLRKAIKLNPQFTEANLNLGAVLKDLGQLRKAEVYTRKAIQLKSDYANAYSNLGMILINLSQLQDAELSTRKAIELNPNFAEAYSNLGNILKDLGNLEEAYNSFVQAIKIKPNFAKAHLHIADIFREHGNYNEAIIYYRKAIELDKNLSSAKSEFIFSKRFICDWSSQDIENTWLDKLGIEGKPINPWPLYAVEDNPLKHLKRSKYYYKDSFFRETNEIALLNNTKIHIGYFSSDFRAHPTMYLIQSILELHDKYKFKIYLYSFIPKEDKYTEIARNSGCIFRDIKELNDTEVVELARKDKLDIAIDLMGYIKYNRMPIFSYRVAPIQINYLAYPGSVGNKNIDYILADNIIIPKDYEKYYSEKILRMPNCYQCNNKKEISDDNISRSELNLPSKGFVFTCFNNNYKISQKEFDIWMRLLQEIKGSVLWLYKSNKWSVKNLKKEAKLRNVDPDRLIFANKLPLKKHLARYSHGDLGLDTFNYNGHTTTSDALWGGLPVLTKIGESFAARVSASILTSIGLPELITNTEKEYEYKALYFANNQDKLLKLKYKLAGLRQTSTLYNSELFTRDLENKFNELINNQRKSVRTVKKDEISNIHSC